MAEEQKNSSAETVDAATSAAHTVKGAIKAGKAISGAAKGAAAGGHYGAVAGAVWAGRKHIGKIIAIIAILLLLPVLFLLMLPGLIFGGLVNAFSPADPDTPILNSETAIVENANDITFTINAILGEALDDVIARIEEDFASSGADQMEIKKLVVAIMSEGHFTSSGHFIVLRGVKDGQIMVADPASYKRSEQL